MEWDGRGVVLVRLAASATAWWLLDGFAMTKSPGGYVRNGGCGAKIPSERRSCALVYLDLYHACRWDIEGRLMYA